MHLASIIIPCYNHGHYLGEALESVIAQSYPTWEAIVVDDGSTDTTYEVATQYVEADDRVSYIYRENAGLPIARNTGIRAAQGEFLAFLDADDAWEPGFLDACISVLSTRPELAGVYTRNLHVDEAGTLFPRIGGQALGASETRERLLKGGFFPPCSVVARLSAVVEAGLFDEQLDGRGTEDWALWLCITQRGNMIGLSQPLARYRIYPGSMSTNADGMHRNRLSVLSKIYGPLEGYPDTWPGDKRLALAHAHATAAREFIAQGEEARGWGILSQAADFMPEILAEPEIHYELACWDQPRGYRGQAELLDLERNSALMIGGLNDLFVQGGRDLRPMRRVAYGQAHLALGMLADQAGRWALARKHILLALYRDPSLLLNRSVVRRALKLGFGHRIVQAMWPARFRYSSKHEDLVL